MRIDDRESDEFKHHEWGFPTKVERLGVGDFIIGKSIIVERKEINDFVGSVDQRLWEQANDLEKALESEDNSVDTIILMLYGKTTDLNRHNMEPRKIDGIYGALARLSISYDVQVFWFREASQMIKQLKKFHSKGGTTTDKQKPHLTKRSFRDNRINVLYGVDGVGYQTALDLVEHFETIVNIAQATVDELMEVPGVGPKTADTIYNAFHSEGE